VGVDHRLREHVLLDQRTRCGNREFLRQRVDVIPAGLTSVSRAAPHAVVFAWFLALVADLHASGKALFFDLLRAKMDTGLL